VRLALTPLSHLLIEQAPNQRWESGVKASRTPKAAADLMSKLNVISLKAGLHALAFPASRLLGLLD
jgi:hypothetical protein